MNIDFKQSFTGKERDPHLKRKLVEPDAQSRLLSLIIEHCGRGQNLSIHRKAFLNSATVTATWSTPLKTLTESVMT